MYKDLRWALSWKLVSSGPDLTEGLNYINMDVILVSILSIFTKSSFFIRHCFLTENFSCKGSPFTSKSWWKASWNIWIYLSYKDCLCGQNVLWGPSPIRMSYEQPLCTLFSKEYRFFHHEDLASWEGFHNSKYCTHLSFNHSIAFSNLSWLFETGSMELSKLYWQRISLKLWDFPLISMNLID